jgi:hypothetical protein
MEGYNISYEKLLKMHIKALFTLDSQSKLVSINEPWDKTRTAPQLYIGKTFDGSVVYRFRYDISFKTVKYLEQYLLNESSNNGNEIKYTNEYLKILESGNYFSEICYYYKDTVSEEIKNNCVKITSENINVYKLNCFEWLNDEIKYSQPCYGIIENGQMVSICRSVRITEKAHEAGIETLERHRGRGLAKIVLKNWAKEIQDKGCIALYSTNKGNESSQRVAEKALLNKYGIGISIK